MGLNQLLHWKLYNKLFNTRQCVGIKNLLLIATHDV